MTKDETNVKDNDMNMDMVAPASAPAFGFYPTETLVGVGVWLRMNPLV